MRICNIAIGAYKTDLNDFEELGKRKYLIDPNYKELSRSEKAQALGKARRKTRDNNILPNYDFGKSPKENAIDLGVSENTIRNSLKDNNIKTPTQDKYDKFIKVYKDNPNASVRDLMRLTGFSNKTIQKYKKKYKND